MIEFQNLNVVRRVTRLRRTRRRHKVSLPVGIARWHALCAASVVSPSLIAPHRAARPKPNSDRTGDRRIVGNPKNVEALAPAWLVLHDAATPRPPAVELTAGRWDREGYAGGQ